MFSRLIPGNYSIFEGSLRLDAHVLDRIEYVSPLVSDDDAAHFLQLVENLDALFKRQNKNLFRQVHR